LRGRRRSQRAELYDSLATMLSAGLPLLEAVETLIESARKSRKIGAAGGLSGMMIDIREQLRSGDSLAQAMRKHSTWFDATEIAIIEAGQHSGTLPNVLASMAQRQEKANELGHKLTGALAYPTLVLLVGLGVVVFLSVKTLPELTKILNGAKIPTPALTARVMWIGQLLAHHWFVILVAIVCVLTCSLVIPDLWRRLNLTLPNVFRKWADRWTRWRSPQVLRTIAVGGLSLRLAELIRSGVPVVEALRVLAPTVSNRRLRDALVLAAERVERGDELSSALVGDDGETWFNAEFRRLLDIGQASGELDAMLERIGERYQRQARRLIERLATLLEPVVILCLAVLVGIVVMAAILPLLRLQEIL